MGCTRVGFGIDLGATGIRWASCDAGGQVQEVEGPGLGPVAAVLPADESIFRMLELPGLGGREVAAAMRWELQRILPFPVEEGVFDYAPLPDSSVMQPDAGMTGAGEAARRRYAVSGGLGEAVDRRLAMLRQRVHAK